MDIKRLNQKIDELEREYEHPDDVAYLESMRKKISSTSLKSQYYNLELSKEIRQYLKNRLREIKIKLSSTEGLEKVDNLALHARRQEIEKLLGFFTDDPVREISSVEKELEEY